MHSLFQDLELVAELSKQRALAEGTWDETTLKLLCDMVTGCDLLLRLSRLGQQLKVEI